MQNQQRPDKMHFDISVESLAQVRCLRSVDNLLVVVQEFKDPVQRFFKKRIYITGDVYLLGLSE